MSAADVVGVDLSLTATGVADALGAHTFRSACSGWERVDELLTFVWRLTRACDLIVIEGYSFGSRASQAHALGELGGIVRFELWKDEDAYADVPPTVLKKFATGKGNAPKDAVLVAAVRAGFDGDDNNAADAWWLRQMGLYRLGCADVPATAYRDEAVAKVAWPTDKEPTE